MRATSLGKVLLLVLACFALSVRGEEEKRSSDELAKQYELEVQPFLEQYCLDCHSGDEPEAGYSFEYDAAPDVPGDFAKWTLVLQKVAGHEMPPEDADQPTDKDREAFSKWIDAGLANFDCTKAEVKPRATVRRLNRAEYNNVVEELFGVGLRPADEFPADDVGEGFDNIGEVLSLPPLLMEKYLDAAELITGKLVSDEEGWPTRFPTLVHKYERFEVEDELYTIATKAFRRPLRDGELDRLVKLYDLAIKREFKPQAAFTLALQAVLVSPQFLFRIEEDHSASGENPIPLDHYAIASRLSFFLWSSLPDDRLLKLAEKKKLNDPKVLARQARRMLRDERARALVDNFAGQWLELRLFSGLAPDPDLFPKFDDELRAAMVNETKEYFAALIDEDGSVLELIDSDYTFLNERLAKHYGVDTVEGEKFQRVSLEDGRRGGILTHASILTLTSNPTRTSPVKRGKWILDNILGTPPPPPPPNIPELEEGDDLLGTLRERMQQHRENPSCAVCHRKMDALGFGFENFDAIGAWREKDGRYAIDASGELPGKKTFKNPAELREILIANSGEFTSCLTRKLLTYALGRALSLRDKCLVDDIVEHAEQHDHRFSEVIVGIVQSDAFRMSGL